MKKKDNGVCNNIPIHNYFLRDSMKSNNDLNNNLNNNSNTNILNSNNSSNTEELENTLKNQYKDLNKDEIRKMIFIYNALNDGWTVNKLENNKFQFKKDKEKAPKEFYLNGFLQDFLISNMNTEILNK